MTTTCSAAALTASEAIAIVLAYDYDRFPTYPALGAARANVLHMTLKAARAPSLASVPERGEPDVHKPLPSPPFDLELCPKPPQRAFVRRPRLRPRPDSACLPHDAHWLPLPQGIGRKPGLNFF